ncbi:MAG: MFS transporter [Halobacteriales archaeon]|nr:MFS transporter [Halobacteriales archaeon]
MSTEDESVDVLAAFRQFFALERDVFVLSIAMFAFSLGFQMTSRYLPEYLAVLGASAGIVGLYGSFGNLVSAVYPYPGGALSDRLGSRISLTAFGLASTLGFAIWLVAPTIGTLTRSGVAVPAWVWIFVGLFLAQAWKSFGLGATFAIVKQSVDPSRLATGFASTEVFRRIGFLVGPLLAAGLIATASDFTTGFQWVLALAVGFGLVATVAQHVLYRSESDSFGKKFEGIAQVLADLRDLPGPLRPLLVGDTLVRFANGMVYVFFVIVITRFLAVDATILGQRFSPAAFFGILLGVEMVVALLVMVPAAKLARSVGLKPVVAAGFLVYATFPVLLINAPPSAIVVGLLFAFSGLRFAGLPAHKALIVGPAEAGAGGRVTGSYYLVRNTLTIPSAAIGGLIYETSPELAFGLASVVGIVGTAYFLVFGEEFAAYARS